MKRIGVLIPAIAERMQHELLNGIHRTASAAGYDVVVLTTATSGLDYHIQSDMMEDEENLFTLLDQIRIDGVLLASQYFCKDALRSMICVNFHANTAYYNIKTCVLYIVKKN